MGVVGRREEGGGEMSINETIVDHRGKITTVFVLVFQKLCILSIKEDYSFLLK